MQYGFIIDNRKCIGCHACTVACKSENDVPIGVNRTWVKYIEKGVYPNTTRHFSVMRCNHCQDAPCVEICPVTALFTRQDGIVDFDPRRCIGCKSCMQACPYDALYIDPETHTAAKCNYCAHRIDIGLEPACVNVCPEHAIISGDMENPTTEIAQLLAREQVTARKVEKGTGPNLFYINGDKAALTPTDTAPSDAYMSSAQTAGVGHFSRYIEERTAQADPEQMIQQLSGKKQGDIPGTTDIEEVKKPAAPRRVYDAPDKGVLWGWEVAAYVWTKAIAAGAFLVPFIGREVGVVQDTDTMWLAWGISLLFLLATTALLAKDLDRPARFLYVLLRPQWKSWLVIGGYALTLYGLILTIWGVATALEWGTIALIAGWLATALAIITAVYTAFLFAQAKGRDFWQSPTLALHMLLHALMAGGAVFAVLFLYSTPTAGWTDFLQNGLMLTVGLNLLVILFEMITPHPTADARRTVELIVRGRFENYFWIGVVMIGNVIPFALAWAGGPLMLAEAGVCILVGMYITEYIWVRAPQEIPLS